MRRVVWRAVWFTLLAALLGSGQAAGAGPLFHVTYRGSGFFQTTYRSEPANPGGKPDHDFAHDSSRERWSITFTQLLSASSPSSLAGAQGSTSITGTIDHVHIDGLYRFDNASVRCDLRSASPNGARLDVVLEIRYRPATHTIVIVATDPLAEALVLLPASCPSEGDAMDGIADNYLEPGFSFTPGFGANRWFQSAPEVVSLRTLQRDRHFTIRIHDTPAGTPPRNCGVPDPGYQQCVAGGRWTGTLTFSRVG